LKKPVISVLIRAPEWINAHSPSIVIRNNGRPRQIHTEGRYLDLGSARPGEMVSDTFPILERSTKKTLGTFPTR
jgi:hypothetical protein